MACAGAVLSARVRADPESVAWLAARGRRLQLTQSNAAAAAALKAVHTALRASPGAFSRVDTAGTVHATECLPTWRVIEHEQREGTLSDTTVAMIAQDRAQARATSVLPDEAVLEAFVQRSKAVDCDAASVSLPLAMGGELDVLAARGDERFGATALEVPLHGWAMPSVGIFVADDMLCLDASAGEAPGSDCLHALPGQPGSRRALFATPEAHADAVRAAVARGRRLATDSFSNKDRARGPRSRIHIAIQFPDKAWGMSDEAVYDKFRLGARRTASAFDRMSYGSYVSTDSFAPIVYTVVNTTFAAIVASGSSGPIKSAAQWIVENHPDPAKRLRFSDYDFQTVTFPENFQSYSWAGLAQMPGSFGEPPEAGPGRAPRIPRLVT